MKCISTEEYYLNSNNWIWRGFRVSWHVKGIENKYPILLLHGFGACGAHWRNNINYFENKGYAVYSIDLIGFGMSAQPGTQEISRLDNGVWCDQVIDFIKEIIRPNSSEKIILIGNSLGSLVALTCAVNIPSEILGMIASPLPDRVMSKNSNQNGKSSFRYIKVLITKIIFALIPINLILYLVKKAGLIELGLKSAYYKKNKIDNQLIKMIKDPVRRKSSGKALRAMSLGMALRNEKLKSTYLLNILDKQNRIPFLLIWGDKDRFIPLFLGKMIANLYSWVELKIITDSGHCVHDEDHIRFNKTSYDWIKNLRGIK